MASPFRPDNGRRGRRVTTDRRGRLAISAVIAAVLCLPLTSCGSDTSDEKGAAAGSGTTTPTSPPTSSPSTTTPAPDPTPVAESRPTYLLDGVVHRSDGSTFRPRVDGQVAGFTGLQDGRWAFATVNDRSGGHVVLTSSSGAPVATYPVASIRLALNSDRSALAWVGRDLKPQVLSSGETDPIALPAIGGDGGGLRGDSLGNMVLAGNCEAECSVLVSAYRRNGASEIWRSSSTEPTSSQWTTKLIDVIDVSPDGTYVSGITRAQEEPTGLCSALVATASGNPLWETCKSSTLRFSPDGAHLLGIDTYLDGAYHGEQFVLDAATGKVLSHLQRPTNDETWLTDDSYVASELGPQGWRLVRHGLDGTKTFMTKPARDDSGEATASPYQLALR